MFRIANTGDVSGTKNFVSREGLATRTAIGDTFGFAGMAMGSATDTLVYRAEAAVVTIHNVVQMPERTDPAAPAANTMRLYARDNGAGKTQLCVRFNTGAVAVLATQP